MTPSNHSLPIDQFPELELLGRIAHKRRISFRLSGSVARNLIEAASAPRQTVGQSLFDAVDPLSDIDIDIDRDQHKEILSRDFAEHLPRSRFFHWEFKTASDRRRYLASANVVLVNQPAILFQGRPDPTEKARMVVGVREPATTSYPAADNVEIHFPVDFSPTPELRLRFPRAEPDRMAFYTLLDLLYLARQPSSVPEDIRSKLGARLTSERAGPILEYVHARPSELARLKFGMLKLLLRQRADDEVPSLFEAADAALLQEISDGLGDPIFDRLLTLDIASSGKDLVAAILPAPDRGVRRFQHVTTVGEEAREMGRLWANHEASMQPGQEPATTSQSAPLYCSPVMTVTTEMPPRPGCCKFRDFAAGVAEIAWTDRYDAGLPKPGTMLYLLSEADHDRDFPILANVRLGRAGSARFDWNVLNILAAKPRKVRLVATGASAP